MNRMAEALRLYQAEQYQAALAQLEPLVAEEPDNAQAWMYYAAALGQLERWSDAVRALREVTRLQPEQPSSYCDLAGALIRTGAWDEAAEAVASALLLAPDHPVAKRLQERIREARRAGPEPEDPAERRRAAAEDFGLPATQEPQPTPSRLPVLLVILAVLLVVVAIVAARRANQNWRLVRQAATLLDQAAAERRRIASLVGEDFEHLDRIGELLYRAERVLGEVAAPLAGEPELSWLRGRLLWYQRGEELAARDQLMQALAELGSAPDGERRPSGWTVGQLRAAVYRESAAIALQTAVGLGGQEKLLRARRDIERAIALAGTPDDRTLQQQIEQALTGRR